MKAEDILTWEEGESCYGHILRVNEVDYEDLNKEEVVAFIIERMEEDVNRDHLIKQFFKSCLEHLQYDGEDQYKRGSCEQCGGYNYLIKYKRYDD